MADGDSIYAASCGPRVTADVNMTGTLAAEVMAEAIQIAVKLRNNPSKQQKPPSGGFKTNLI